MPRIEHRLRVDGSPSCPVCPVQWEKGSVCWASQEREGAWWKEGSVPRVWKRQIAPGGC